MVVVGTFLPSARYANFWEVINANELAPSFHRLVHQHALGSADKGSIIHGVVILATGLVILAGWVVFLMTHRRLALLLSLLAATVAAAGAVYEIVAAQRIASFDLEAPILRFGLGLFVVALGAILGVVASFMAKMPPDPRSSEAVPRRPRRGC